LKANSGAARGNGERFRIAIMGDFSGRALRGELVTGDDLAAIKPLRVDVDNLDDLIERMGIKVRLPIGGEQADSDEGVVEVEIESIDDFHPDELYDKLEIFEELSSLRGRLNNDRTFAAAAKEVRGWAEDLKPTRRRKKRPSRGSTVPVGGRMSDFARLTGRAAVADTATPDVEDLIKRIVGPFIASEVDPDRDRLIAAVDQSLSAAMRAVLHQSDFQSMESIWRGVDLIVRSLETGSSLQVVLYDVSAEEIASDLSGTDDLESTGLYKLLVEQPAMDAAQGPLAAILGYYIFDETPPHAELLGRIAKIAAAANAPFVSSISKNCLERKKNDTPHPLVVEAWGNLKELPEAKYLALTVPQFLLRLPYGKKSDPISSFSFEEFTPQTGVSGMLWGNGVLLVGLMLGQTYAKQGIKKMQIGSIMSFGDMPFHYCVDAHGDQIALPCTDRLLSQRMAEAVIDSGYIPLLSIQGQPVVRLGSTRSVAGVELAGVWPESADAAKMQAADRERAAKRESQLRTKVTPKPRPSGESDSFRDDLAWKMKDGTFEDDDSSEEDSSSGDSDDNDFGSMLGDDDSSPSYGGDTDDTSSDTDDSDTDLEALLASLGGGDDDSSESGSGNAGTDSSDDDTDGLDPELAALLADL
jgi:type VI secretion system ImpC/EvpB family protein/type VI secretion system ImpB/VipA family protein